MTDLEKKAYEVKMQGDQNLLEKAGEVGESIGEGAVKGYKAIESTVVSTYKKIENGVVGTYKKVEDAFVEKYLLHEGETVEDAKKRLATEQAAREGKQE